MGIVSTLRSMVGGGDEPEHPDEEQGDPSHRCPSCGEEYFTDPDVEINKCRGCGGAKVEAID